MNLLRRWKERRLAEIERAARERDAAEAEAARQRVLEMARRQREDPDPGADPEPTRSARAWHDPTIVLGLPLLTYGQQRLYRTPRQC